MNVFFRHQRYSYMLRCNMTEKQNPLFIIGFAITLNNACFVVKFRQKFTHFVEYCIHPRKEVMYRNTSVPKDNKSCHLLFALHQYLSDMKTDSRSVAFWQNIFRVKLKLHQQVCCFSGVYWLLLSIHWSQLYFWCNLFTQRCSECVSAEKYMIFVPMSAYIYMSIHLSFAQIKKFLSLMCVQFSCFISLLFILCWVRDTPPAYQFIRWFLLSFSFQIFISYGTRLMINWDPDYILQRMKTFQRTPPRLNSPQNSSSFNTLIWSISSVKQRESIIISETEYATHFMLFAYIFRIFRHKLYKSGCVKLLLKISRAFLYTPYRLHILMCKCAMLN